MRKMRWPRQCGRQVGQKSRRRQERAGAAEICLLQSSLEAPTFLRPSPCLFSRKRVGIALSARDIALLSQYEPRQAAPALPSPVTPSLLLYSPPCFGYFTHLPLFSPFCHHFPPQTAAGVAEKPEYFLLGLLPPLQPSNRLKCRTLPNTLIPDIEVTIMAPDRSAIQEREVVERICEVMRPRLCPPVASPSMWKS